MYEPKPNPRKEYRRQESQRVEDSATLAETFRDLKSLTLDLAYFSPGSFTRNSEIKYTVNLANAKSRFRFNCPNEHCVGGDFDLSTTLSKAVVAHQTTLAGEVVCQGWSCQTAIGQAHCLYVLRYKLSAEYAPNHTPAITEPNKPEEPEIGTRATLVSTGAKPKPERAEAAGRLRFPQTGRVERAYIAKTAVERESR